MASSAILVLAGWMLAKYLTSLSPSIWRAIIVCSTASWWELAEFRKYSVRENAQNLWEERAADTSMPTSVYPVRKYKISEDSALLQSNWNIWAGTQDTSKYFYKFTLKNHFMFQSAVALMMLHKYRISTTLQYKRVTNSTAKEEGKAWYNSRWECFVTEERYHQPMAMPLHFPASPVK